MKTIPLNDPRFAAIASEELDGGALAAAAAIPASIAIAPPAISVRRDGNVALFKIGETETAVQIENDAATFFPDRSSAHRQLLAALGINE